MIYFGNPEYPPRWGYNEHKSFWDHWPKIRIVLLAIGVFCVTLAVGGFLE